MLTHATISHCQQYRYNLSRTRNIEKKSLVWILLNPSTADEKQDDPTIRRVVGFSEQFGYGGCIVYNLFALRSTNPKNLKTHHDPIGPENNHYLQSIPLDTTIVFARGNHGTLHDRSTQVIDLLQKHNIRYLDITKSHQPKHPLYIGYDTIIKPRI